MIIRITIGVTNVGHAECDTNVGHAECDTNVGHAECASCLQTDGRVARGGDGSWAG